LAAGVTVLEIVRTGKVEAGALAKTMGKVLVVSAALYPVDLALRAFAYPALISAGPAGWAGIAAIEVAKLVGTIYLFNQLDSTFNLFGNEKKTQPTPADEKPADSPKTPEEPKSDGVKDKIDDILSDNEEPPDSATEEAPVEGGSEEGTTDKP
jgi:hypothetical protein